MYTLTISHNYPQIEIHVPDFTISVLNKDIMAAFGLSEHWQMAEPNQKLTNVAKPEHCQKFTPQTLPPEKQYICFASASWKCETRGP